jgi:hypothetical protein
MAHISAIGAGLYSDLSVHSPATELTAAGLAALDTAAEFQALFATEIANVGGTKAAGAFVRIANVREFPAIGTPANVVNVPAYGQRTSSQIQGQADAPSMELTINYVGTEWGNGTSILAGYLGDGVQRVFRFTLLNSDTTGTGATKYASTAGGLGTVPNSQFYFVGKLEAMAVNPQLTDANTATLTLTVQGSFFGAYTI